MELHGCVLQYINEKREEKNCNIINIASKDEGKVQELEIEPVSQ